MSEITEKRNVAIADHYPIEGVERALKGGVGAARRVLKDTVAAPSRSVSPGTTRGRACDTKR